jgi:hypothetical protein
MNVPLTLDACPKAELEATPTKPAAAASAKARADARLQFFISPPQKEMNRIRHSRIEGRREHAWRTRDWKHSTQISLRRPYP